MLTVYLAGPIELIGLERAREWREQAIRLCDTTFTSLLPVNPLDYEPEQPPFNDEQIVNTDKWLLNDADVLLVDGRQPGWGTSMEVLLGWQAHKLVVVWGIGRNEASIWLRYHAAHFEPSLTEALEYLYSVAGGGVPA